MATVFLAARGARAVREKLGIRKENKYAPILRWIGVAVGGVVAVLGVLSFFLPVGGALLWAGIYGVIAGVIVALLESQIPIICRLLGFLLEVFYWRALVYICLSIACYFATVLIVGGILLDLLAVAYIVVAYFFKEREYYDAATIAAEEEKQRKRQALQQSTKAPSLDI